MNDIALVTPSYPRDLERCALLCESIDVYVKGFSKHYVIVRDDCIREFALLAGPRRVIVPASQLLPQWLISLPRFVNRRGRHYWWSLRTQLVDGWQAQQILKIAAVCTLPQERYCIVDSDIVFFRPFDVSAYARPAPLPLFSAPAGCREPESRYGSWIRKTRGLLGIADDSFPAEYFITHIVLWDQRAARAMIEHIEAINRMPWVEALCRARYDLSEYLLYGYFVGNEERYAREHVPRGTELCLAYWDKRPLSQAEVREKLHRALPHCVGFGAANYSETSVEMMREVVLQQGAAR